MVWYSHLFTNFLQFVAIHSVKGFNVVNEAEADVFLELLNFHILSLLYFLNPIDIFVYT